MSKSSNTAKMKTWDIILLTITILSIGVAVAFGIVSLKKMNPVYDIKKDPSIIYNENIPSPRIKMVIDDSVLIEENVYVATMVLWNKGNLSIDTTAVRRDFFVKMKEGGTILDYDIIKQADTISNFKLKKINNDLLIEWDYFDPGQGAEIQVIYTGNREDQPFIEGSVIGKNVKKAFIKGKSGSIWLMLYILFCGMFVFMFCGIWVDAYKKNEIRKTFWPGMVVSIGLIVFAILMYFAVFKELIKGGDFPF